MKSHQIPSVQFLRSKSRLLKGIIQAYTMELIDLASDLQKNKITQTIYDECIEAMDKDIQFLKSEIESMKILDEGGENVNY